jgi:hypothetical protein
MTGTQFLDFLVGKSGQIGLLDKNINDTSYRAFMLSCLNLVLKDIQNRQQSWHWRWLEKTATAPTVAAQIDYDLPTDVDTNKIFAVYDRTKDRTYKYIPYERFVRLVADPSNSSGDSVWYTFWASMIKLYPIPASVITFYLDYVSMVTALTDAAVSCELPAKYDPVVIDGALTYAYKFDPDMGVWTQQQAIYEAGIAKMIADNNMMINDGGETESHRFKRGYGADNGKHGMFPVSL